MASKESSKDLPTSSVMPTTTSAMSSTTTTEPVTTSATMSTTTTEVTTCSTISTPKTQTSNCPTSKSSKAQPPTSQAPTLQASSTSQAPTSQVPTSPPTTLQAPTSQVLTPQAPMSQASMPKALTSQVPTSQSPTSQASTSQAPTFLSPARLATLHEKTEMSSIEKTGEREKNERKLTKEQRGYSREKMEMPEQIAVNKQLKPTRFPPMDTASISSEPFPDPPSKANVIPDPVTIVPVQETGNNNEVHLTNCPNNLVEKETYFNYRRLVLLIAHLINIQQLYELIVWARERVIVSNRYSQVWEVFYQLDRENLINASNLTLPLAFFEGIGRFDIVYLIEEFLSGNYAILHSIDFSQLPEAPTLDHLPGTEPDDLQPEL